jgi:hypothetical protein
MLFFPTPDAPIMTILNVGTLVEEQDEDDERDSAGAVVASTSVLREMFVSQTLLPNMTPRAFALDAHSPCRPLADYLFCLHRRLDFYLGRQSN